MATKERPPKEHRDFVAAAKKAARQLSESDIATVAIDGVPVRAVGCEVSRTADPYERAELSCWLLARDCPRVGSDVTLALIASAISFRCFIYKQQWPPLASSDLAVCHITFVVTESPPHWRDFGKDATDE